MTGVPSKAPPGMVTFQRTLGSAGRAECATPEASGSFRNRGQVLGEGSAAARGNVTMSAAMDNSRRPCDQPETRPRPKQIVLRRERASLRSANCEVGFFPSISTPFDKAPANPLPELGAG